MLSLTFNFNVCFVARQKESRVDWMYSGPASTVDREEYLLGKKIDKYVDPTLTEEAREKEVYYSYWQIHRPNFDGGG